MNQAQTEKKEKRWLIDPNDAAEIQPIEMIQLNSDLQIENSQNVTNPLGAEYG